jgi:hypothetical protein
VLLVPGLPTASDAATHFAGNAGDIVPHDAGLLLPEFTVSFWVELVEPITDPNWFFFSKEASGFSDGDWGRDSTGLANLTLVSDGGRRRRAGHHP